VQRLCNGFLVPVPILLEALDAFPASQGGSPEYYLEVVVSCAAMNTHTSGKGDPRS
jgi:hypothetical protein